MANIKNIDIRDIRDGTGRYQPAFVDVLIGDVLVKGIEVYLDKDENPQIKFPVHEVPTRYGKSEIEIINIPGEIRESIVSELMDNFENKICPKLSNGIDQGTEKIYNDFLPRLDSL